MAQVLNKDPATYEKEKESFIRELQHFHETRGTPSRRAPKISGHEVDLYLLYVLVTSRGGWVKVNSRNEWDKIVEDFSIPKNCVNNTVAIKQIYLRYLDRYEKVHYLGEVGERAGDDDEDSRHRRWSARALHSVPLTYNHAQHTVNESLREYNGLSIDLYRPSEYEKLGISLVSPLPNEQDFAINVCTILSNEGKHTLKLGKHPKLLHFLLAHATVFSHPNLRTLFTEHYNKVRGHSISSFWEDVVADPSLLRLADESQFISSIELFNSIVTPIEVVNIKPSWKVEPEDMDLFCLGRTLGTQDYIGQRVSQIATILRNLSFTLENISIMGKDITFLRFVLLCCGSKWNNLQQIGWDILGNIAHEVTVQCPLMDDILNMTTLGLVSEDRAIILASLEVLNKLGQNENNEDVLLRSLDFAVYERVLSFLTLHDIMLLVHTLECLNSLSSLGEKACNSIIRVRGSLDTLVSLITVEAQSYGPRACIQMRVVETVTGGVGLPLGNLTPAPAPPPPPPPPQPVPIPQTPQPQITPPPTPAATIQTTPHRVLIQNTQNSAHATQQVAQENEQFALAWLRTNFEPTSTGRIEQAELYKQYINYCAKIGRRGVIAPLHFPRCVRSVFGGSVGPKQAASGDPAQHFYEGIQVRVKPLLPQQTLTPTPSNTLQTTPSPILKAQLSAPPKPTPTSTSPQPAKVTQRQQQQKLLQQQQTPSTTVSHWAPSVTGPASATCNVVTEKIPTSSSITTSVSAVFSNKSPVSSRINGIRTTFLDSTVELKSESSNESESTVTSYNFSGDNSLGKPPPLAPLSKNIKQNNNNIISPEETDSAGNSVASSTGIRDNCSATGGEEGENSTSSFDGFLINGIPSSFEVDDSTSKDSTPRSMMLADLLEKNSDKSDPPVLNGSLRIGDKGLELVQGSESKTVVSTNGTAITINGNGETVEEIKEEMRESSRKRPAENDLEEACEPSKKPHMNGDVRLEEPPEEGNVSSTAANLYAALAADALEDEPIEETPAQPPVLVASTQPRQILVAAPGSQIAQRVVVGGQHYVVAQPQTALVQGQTQTVLVAQTPQQQGTGAKTIIILQPQGVASGGSPQKVIVQRLQSPPPPPLQPTAQVSPTIVRPETPPKPPSTPPLISPSPRPHQPSETNVEEVKLVKPPSPPPVSPVNHHLPPVAMPSLAAPCATPVSVTSTPAPCNSLPKEIKPQPKLISEHGHFLCEWRGCMRNFKSGNEVYMHACEAHCPQGSQEIQCLWERCDAMKRKRFSLMTHLYDRHCNADVMRMMAVRRKQLSVSGRSEIPPPTPPTPHPGYAPNAAFHAIKRHALEFVNPKELQDDNEGPVTKSIRLTAALILRNLVIYSTHGRRYLIRYEPHLASVALSNVESSRTIAQLLFDMNQPR